MPGIGIVLMLTAAGFGVHSWLFARSQQRAIATVDQNVESFAKDGGLLYTPNLLFRDAAGKAIIVKGPSAEDEPELAAGTTIPVLYPADAPDRAIVANTAKLYRVAITFGLLGVAIFDAGWIVRLKLSKRAA
jgi:hypothetical protein